MSADRLATLKRIAAEAQAGLTPLTKKEIAAIEWAVREIERGRVYAEKIEQLRQWANKLYFGTAALDRAGKEPSDA